MARIKRLIAPSYRRAYAAPLAGMIAYALPLAWIFFKRPVTAS